MATDFGSTAQTSITVLLRGIVNDAQELIQQQLQLFRKEIKEDFRKTRQGALILAAGAGVVFLGVTVLVLMLPLLLNTMFPRLDLWLCFGIVGAIGTAIGAALLYAGIRRIKSFDLIPDQAVDALRENLTWTTHPK